MSNFIRTLAVTSVCSIGLVLSACSSSGTTPEETDPNNNSSQASPTIDLVPTVGDTAIGKVFTAGDNTLTLYTQNSAEPNTFACDAACEAIWPPLLTTVTTTGISGEFDVIARTDGQSQWMLKGYPLYFYTGDAAAGDVAGEGINSQWYVARPIPVDSASSATGEEVTVASGSVIVSDGVRVDRDGFSLYTFANDTDGVSNCADGCATAWPPLYADEGARGYDRYSLIERVDDLAQWAYDGKALYFYEGDNAAGDANGDGVGGVWSIAMP